MKNSIHELLSTVAENNNLTVVETTSEANGYPSNTSFSIIGFESTEQFHAVEQELNELLCLHKETEGNEHDEFLDVQAQDLHRRDGFEVMDRYVMAYSYDTHNYTKALTIE